MELYIAMDYKIFLSMLLFVITQDVLKLKEKEIINFIMNHNFLKVIRSILNDSL